MTNIKTELLNKKDFFDKRLAEFFVLDNICIYNNEFTNKIYEVMSYSLFSDAKRLRPICLIETANLYGVNIDEVIVFAIALELIHTYSLIHDDLPAMDDDDMRRGKATSHIKYSEADAILAGDGLLNLAHTILFDEIIKSGYLPNVVKASREISLKSGISGMISGQVADIISQNQNGNLQTLEFIHKNKTGAILEAAFVAGAYLGNASDYEIEIFRNIALKTGYAFQIKDDILDVTGDTSKLGKNIGKDKDNKKLTYPSIMGVDKSEQMVKRLSEDAIKLLSELPYNTEFLESLVRYLIYREN